MWRGSRWYAASKATSSWQRRDSGGATKGHGWQRKAAGARSPVERWSTSYREREKEKQRDGGGINTRLSSFSLVARRGSAANPREEKHVVSFNQRVTSGSYGVTDSRVVRRRREELTDSRDRETDTENYKNRWLARERASAYGSLYSSPCRWIVDGKNQQTSFPWWLPPPSTHAKPDDRDSLSPVYIRQLSVVNKGDHTWNGKPSPFRGFIFIRNDLFDFLQQNKPTFDHRATFTRQLFLYYRKRL